MCIDKNFNSRKELNQIKMITSFPYNINLC